MLEQSAPKIQFLRDVTAVRKDTGGFGRGPSAAPAAKPKDGKMVKIRGRGNTKIVACNTRARKNSESTTSPHTVKTVM
jgi:hypothetical protein